MRARASEKAMDASDSIRIGGGCVFRYIIERRRRYSLRFG